MASVTYIGPWQLLPFNGFQSWSPPDGSENALDLRSNTEQNKPGTGLFVMPDGIDPGPDYEPMGAGPLSDIFPKEDQRSIFASRIGLKTVLGDTWADWIYTALTLQADIFGEVSAKPLMPTHDGFLELHLNGIVVRKAFDLAIPEAAPVIAAMKEQYRVYRQDSIDGKLGDDPQMYLRILDAWGQKFRVNNPQDIFVPADLPKEAPLPHKTTIQDDFTRTDSALTLGTATGPNSGFTYNVVIGNTFGINTNSAYVASFSTTAPSALASATLSSSDMLSQLVVGATLFAYWGPVVRSDGVAINASQNQYYGQQGSTTDNKLYFSKMVAGVQSNVANTASTFSASDTQAISASGTTVKRFKNGSQVGTSTTDTSLASGTTAGIFISSAVSTAKRLNLFLAQDLSAAAAQELSLTMTGAGA